MGRTEFVGIKLTPGKAQKLMVPEGEFLQIQQIVLAGPAKPGATAVVSIKTGAFPELVLCTLRAGTEMTAVELIISPDDEASLTVKGAAVDVCAHYLTDNDDEDDGSDGEIDSDEAEADRMGGRELRRLLSG